MGAINHFFGAFIAVWLTYIILEKPSPKESLSPDFPLRYAIALLFLCGIAVVLLAQSFANVCQNRKGGFWYRIKKYSIPLFFSFFVVLLISFFERALDLFKPFKPTEPAAFLFIILIIFFWVIAFEKMVFWDKRWRDSEHK
ncbi:MAG TPA: hypothetical protein ACFYD6_11600 [Candidatus Brocadiia bacterium]|nr:hypothetical protein [Candidatus Brocadiales bacterium]